MVLYNNVLTRSQNVGREHKRLSALILNAVAPSKLLSAALGLYRLKL